MAKPKKLCICALNVVIHDKNKRNYKELFRDAANLLRIVTFNRTHAASMIWTSEVYFLEKKYLTGLIFRFINVSPPYFDTDKREVVVDSEGRPINLVPPHIKSNTKEVRFVLLEDIHRIFVDLRFISPALAKTFFETLFEAQEIQEKYGQVDVSIHSEQTAIKNILSMFSIRSLSISVSKPNPIGASRFDEEVFGAMEREGVDNLFLELKTKRDGVTPSEQTKKYMHTASNHGKVVAKGINPDGNIVQYSTEDYPMSESTTLTKDQPYFPTFIGTAKRFWSRIVKEGNEDITK